MELIDKLRELIPYLDEAVDPLLSEQEETEAEDPNAEGSVTTVKPDAPSSRWDQDFLA